MGNIKELLKAIKELENEISEYKEQIIELEEIAAFIRNEYCCIEEKVNVYTKDYDMTHSAAWRGNTLNDAEELAGICVNKLDDAQGDTQKLLNDIARCTEILEQKIYDCQLLIQSIEGQLNCA